MEVEQFEKRLSELISAECQINYDDDYLFYIVVARPFFLAKGVDALATLQLRQYDGENTYKLDYR